MRSFCISISLLIAYTFSCFAQLNTDEKNVFFKESTVPRLDIFIYPDSLDVLLNDITTDHEYIARFIFNNFSGKCDTIENVGFRIRGNVSRLSNKKSFKISINTYSPGRKYCGLEKINLTATGDFTYLKPKLCWYLCREMGIPSISINHVMLYVNGQLFGVYTNVESIDEEYTEKTFGNKDGNLYKCRYPSDLVYISDNPDDYKIEQVYFGDRLIREYELHTNKEADDYTDLMLLTRTLADTTASDFKSKISAMVNIQDLLRFFALEVYLGHWDSYSVGGNNYYLYHNTQSNKFEYITYDMDLTLGDCFGAIDVVNQNIYSFTPDFTSKPLRKNILSIPEYRNNYTFYLKQLITSFPPDTLRKLAEKIQNYIAPYVQQDPYFTFTMDEFFSSLDSPFNFSPYGIIEYFNLRYNSILTQLDGSNTSPILSEINYCDHAINDTIMISCRVDDENTNTDVKIYYRVNNGNLLEKQMNFAKKGSLAYSSFFTAKLNPLPAAGNITFYIEAKDNSGNVSRMPVDGYYNIAIISLDNHIKINEILAANVSCMTDESGQKEDWIELHNSGTSAVNLKNVYLSDSYNNPNKSNLPAILVQPGEYVWFWADDEPKQGDNHLKFKLSQDGESVYLFEAIGESYILVDSMNFPKQDKNISFGYLPGSPNNLGALQHITPGYSNDTRGLAYAIFNVDMGKMIEDYTFLPETDKLDVVGDFNNWNGSSLFFDTNQDSVFTQTTYGLLEGNNIQYKYRINQDNSNLEFNNLAGGSKFHVYKLKEGCNYITDVYNVLDVPDTAQNNFRFKFFPNPASDYITISMTSGSFKYAEITDINGSVILHVDYAETNETNINMQGIPKGIYFLKVVSVNGKIWFKKIMKM